MGINLKPLYEIQRGVRETIRDKHGDRNDWPENLLLALAVEVGECANEWQMFKLWKQNPSPRTVIKEKCKDCGGRGIELNLVDGVYPFCHRCDGSGEAVVSKPLLEEYADVLAFTLELGLEHGYELDEVTHPIRYNNPTSQFNIIFTKLGDFNDLQVCGHYWTLVRAVIGLYPHLGFKWQEVIDAYQEKSKVNHTRQKVGY